MTGMKNRYAYEKILEDLEDGICNWKNAVLIFMDMNHLKQINDIYGHGAGDELLIEQHRVSRKRMEVSDIVFG